MDNSFNDLKAGKVILMNWNKVRPIVRLGLSFIFQVWLIPFCHAVQVLDTDPNNTPADAQPIQIGDSMRGNLPFGDTDYYWFQAQAGYTYNFTHTEGGTPIQPGRQHIEIYAADGTSLLAQGPTLTYPNTVSFS